MNKIPKQPFLLKTAHERIGDHLGTSDWVFIDQVQVNVFGEVTRWRTPGHCDPEYGKNTRYGGTLMHGFHVVSLLSHFFQNIGAWPADGGSPLNYGLDKVRVLQPIIIGDGVNLRSHVSLLAVTDKGRGEYLVKTKHEIEASGVEGYVVVAEYLTYWFPIAAK
ncbi:MAG: MaoC/PaaZ C-terminal domain-containing protein [Proteobacteria bacterium]|jgi:acyl dehydratase|nr:MaoC/PaaZ C-terminal domain-containing protein [Pseudomonadota bacterium]MDA1300704.1 MaoC/PaaZ C-terminal domain-containing protein [Pseudomonadota bacterium]